MLTKDRVQQLDTPSRKGYDAIFNARILEDIPDALSQWNSSRILIVASKGLISSSPVINELQESLGRRPQFVKIGVGSHSPYTDIQDIALRIQQLQIDCVISIGSCSYSDACKIGCLLAANLPPKFEINDIEAIVDKDRGIADSKDGNPLKPRTCKLIVVPTSLSASEWNAISSATNSQGKKQHFGLWDVGQPDLILMDPEIASTSPERLWLSSGVRCIDHCVELMCNPQSGEKGFEGVHIHAEKGLRCMIAGLREYHLAKKQNSGQIDKNLLLQGISECQYGSREALTGLLIWRVPMGPSHAIGHQLGSVAKVMHGITSCIMLAPVLKWQAEHMSNPYYKETQKKILNIFNEILGWQEKSASDAMVRFVRSLGLPATLKEVNVVSDEQIKEIAEKTMTDVWGGGKRQMEFDGVMEVLNSVRG